MKRLLWLLTIPFLFGFTLNGANIPTWNGATISTWNGLSVGTTGSYSDNFNRSNGTLGSNWSEPDGAAAGLQIYNNMVYTATPGLSPPLDHSFEIYTGGTFSQNQWTSETIETTNIYSMLICEASTTQPTYWNDAVCGTQLRLGIHNGAGFADVYIDSGTTFAVGDIHEMDVAGNGPQFVWIKKNGVVVGSWASNTYVYNGIPGLGVIDNNTSLTNPTDNWQGGSLPAFSSTSSDNFQRADSGWLGVNWFPCSGYASYVLSGNKAVPSGLTSPAPQGATIWTTPFTLNQYSKITVGGGSFGTGADWLGPIVREDPTQPYTADNYYLAMGFQGNIYLYVRYNGNFVGLTPLGTYTLTSGDTFELQATGTNPVVLSVYINGVQFGSTFNDFTYKLSGTYAGFSNYGSINSTVSAWIGGGI